MSNLIRQLRVLRHRDFRYLWLAQSASVIGDCIVIVALALFVIELTGSATDLGFVLAAASLPLVAFLLLGGVFSASTVVLSSASSKTASGLAFLLSRRDGVEVVGLTSERSAAFTDSLGVYDRVVTYGEIESLADTPAVYVDMAGDAHVRSDVHTRYGDALMHSAVVGATHHDRMGAVPDSLPGPPPTFFFAPDRVSKRSTEWGRDGFETRIAEAWRPYVQWCAGWLEVIRNEGPAALEQAYLDLLDGNIDPAKAHVLSLPA